MAELYWSAKKSDTKQETRKESLQVASLLFPSSFEKSRKCDEVPGKCEYTNIINQTIEKSKCCCSVRATDEKYFYHECSDSELGVEPAPEQPPLSPQAPARCSGLALAPCQPTRVGFTPYRPAWDGAVAVDPALQLHSLPNC